MQAVKNKSRKLRYLYTQACDIMRHPHDNVESCAMSDLVDGVEDQEYAVSLCRRLVC